MRMLNLDTHLLVYGGLIDSDADLLKCEDSGEADMLKRILSQWRQRPTDAFDPPISDLMRHRYDTS